MKAGLYVRISTGEQSKYSLEAQEDQLKRYCKEKNINSYDLYQDTKGRFTFEERQGLMKLLDDVEKGLIGLILVTELDRLAGDEGILGYIKYTLKKNNSKLISINEQDKVKNEYEELIESILTAVAKFENKRKKLRCRRGIAKAKEQGKMMNRVPFGYKILNKGTKESKLIIDMHDAELVKMIYKMFKQGQSIYKISKALNINKSSINYILNNEFYWNGDLNGKHEPIIKYQ